MNELKKFDNSAQKNRFYQVLKNFGRAVLFIGLVVFSGLWLMGIVGHTTHHLACDAETVYPKNKTDHFYQDGNYFSGGSQQSSDYALDGKHSMKLTKEYPFGFNLDYEYLVGNEEVTVWCWRYAEGDWAHHGKIIASIDGKFWKATEAAVHRNEDGWEKIEFTFQVPQNTQNEVLHLYCWNPFSQPIYFDDFHVVLREQEEL